ncbi:hypothetical protein OAQ14_03385 [Gammaproteobacteria bacterium]|nr:hypothetical protein [Gammaproteobacteria bacterium]
MLNDGLKLTGKLSIAINNEVVQEIPNVVVTDGKGFVASRMKNATATAMSHMAIGTGSTAAAASDSALGSESGRVSLTSTTVTNNEVEYVATFGAGTGTGAITEAGILNASSSGTLLCRTVFSVVNKGAADSMTITWTVTVS